MSKLALFVKVKAQPGKREQVKQTWEELVKPHVENEEKVNFSIFSYSNDDDDTIFLFELISDPESFKAATQEDWFVDYMEKLKPLLASPPERIMATPVWIKGAS